MEPNAMDPNTTEELTQELIQIDLLPLRTRLSAEEIETRMADTINAMIRDDFSGLVQLLYRIDVEEPRLRYLLQQHKGEDAGRIIARLIIDRLLMKIETRKKYSEKKRDIPDEERW